MLMLMLFIFALGLVIELAFVMQSSLWKYKISIVAAIIILIGSMIGVVIANLPLGNTLVISSLAVFRVINLLRIFRPNYNHEYLRKAVPETSIILSLLLVIFLTIFLVAPPINVFSLLFLFAGTSFVFSLMVLGIVSHNLFKTRHLNSSHYYSDDELPTISIAIPSRNETQDLASCLYSVLASDYPKLEVLVLDDCSQDHTADIIKSFAHEGVRFVPGREPSSRWLAKNLAYDKLADEATGDYILFLGVDMRIGPEAVRSLITTCLNKKRNMISVMPYRIGGGVQSSVVQPMRYWWEIALPRRFFNKPPVLSSCWIIHRKALLKLGGLEAVAGSITPEAYFARELIKSDKYAFIRADEHLNIRTVKDVSSQLSTAIRTSYPTLKKKPELVLLMIYLELILLLGPFLVFGISLWAGYDLATGIAGLAALLLIIAHYLILSASNPANSVIALVNFPFVVVTEIIIQIVSMYKYEFSVVSWRGRNICIPVMRVYSELPRTQHD